MSSFAFVEMPAFGHVNPSLPLVRELVRRGEHVVYYNDAEFRSVVEAAGAEFRAYPPGVLTSGMIARATQTGDLVRVPRLILRATDTLAPLLVERLTDEQPAAIVLDSNAVWGQIAARSLRMPTVSLLTTVLLGAAAYRRMRLREWIHTLRPMLPSIVPIVVARSHLLRQFGASVPRPAFPAFGGLNLALFPRILQSPDRRIDATVRFVGPMIDPDTRAERVFQPPTVEPVVYMSLGTLHRAPAELYRQCLEVFADLPVRFVLSTGGHVDISALGPVPPNADVRPFAPQLAVLQRAAVFITHGGMNSVLEGLASGVPLLVIPQHAEQLAIGLSVAERGAAIVRREHLAGQQVDARVLRRDVESLLTAARFKRAATELQGIVRETGGFRQAADEVQAFAAAHSRPTGVLN